MKTKVDNLDVDKPNTVPADLSKLSNLLFNDVLKKTVCNGLVMKIIAIDTKIPSASRLVTWKEYLMIDKRILNARGLFKKADYNTKIEEIETRYLVLLD